MLAGVAWQICLGAAALGCAPDTGPSCGSTEAATSGQGGHAGTSTTGGAGGNGGSPVDSHQHLAITVIGPTELVEDLSAPSLERAHLVPDPQTGRAEALYNAPAGADWSSAFTFTNPDSHETSLTIRPWICKTSPYALDAAKMGRMAVEQRTIEIDAMGQFWTNGLYGRPFASVCSYATSPNSGGGLAVIQDGPSKCTEPTRRKTKLEVRDKDGKVVSRPEVCVAHFGKLINQAPEWESTVDLAGTRDADGPDDVAFGLSLYACVHPGQAAPFDVTASDFNGPQKCGGDRAYKAFLTVGADVKPSVYSVTSGVWHIDAASSKRDDIHLSEIDLTFTGPDNAIYSVKGHMEVPQFME